MKHEGTLRQHVKKGERFEDLECYSILKSEWTLASGGELRRARKVDTNSHE